VLSLLCDLRYATMDEFSCKQTPLIMPARKAKDFSGARPEWLCSVYDSHDEP